jgi:hypothetical protein
MPSLTDLLHLPPGFTVRTASLTTSTLDMLFRCSSDKTRVESTAR